MKVWGTFGFGALIAAAAIAFSPQVMAGPQTGIASVYANGDGHAWSKTANGERFDQNAMTAAHRTLSFNTCVRVVLAENGRSVEVRINDRGPFVANRIIDVSAGAARVLGLTDSGVARVRLYRCDSRSVLRLDTDVPGARHLYADLVAGPRSP